MRKLELLMVCCRRFPVRLDNQYAAGGQRYTACFYFIAGLTGLGKEWMTVMNGFRRDSSTGPASVGRRSMLHEAQ